MNDQNRKATKEETGTKKKETRRHLQSTAIFATNLKFLLNRNGMTAKQLSKEIGVSEQSISSWMTNVRSPRASMVEDIARFFGVRAIDMQDPLGNAGLIPNHDVAVKVPMAGKKESSATFIPSGNRARLTAAMICTDDDMSPIIKKGDIVLYTSACVSYREGSLVVVHKPNGVLTVRRIYLYEGDPTFILAADGNVPPETLKKEQLKSVVVGRPVFVQRNIENA